MRCAGTDERDGTGGRDGGVRTDERGRRSQGHGPDLVLRVGAGERAPPRRRRRVVALSAADRERVARGELPEAAAEEARRRRVDALTDARSRPDGDARANDSRLLRDVPPHW